MTDLRQTCAVCETRYWARPVIGALGEVAFVPDPHACVLGPYPLASFVEPEPRERRTEFRPCPSWRVGTTCGTPIVVYRNGKWGRCKTCRRLLRREQQRTALRRFRVRHRSVA